MSENVRELVKQYHAFYEVLPYYELIEERHGSPTATRRTIQHGFDVDVHGLSDNSKLELPPPAEYASAYADLKKIADDVSHHGSECSIEVISFASSVFFEARRHFHPEGVIRIRISHYRGIEKAADLPEQHALAELEKRLQDLGLARR